MKIKYYEGNVFKGPFEVIVHGCNDQGVMGSGIALQVKTLYPEAYDVYRKEFLKKDGLLEGGTFTYAESNGKTIVNMITQNFYGRDGKRYVKYDWIADGFYELDRMCESVGQKNIAMPQIGAGLGGGDWGVIEKIIESECKFVQPNVYIYK